jgi:Ca2+-binding RTX toxin-like protein
MAVTFSELSTTTFPGPAAGGRMTFIDADGDGDLDILYQTGANGTAYQYAIANGDGTYTIVALGSSPFAGLTIADHNGANFHVGDIDGDGDFDLWVGQTTGAGTGSYFRNDGGTFSSQSSATFPSPGASSRVVMADFDGDGDADMLYQTVGNGTAFQYALSNGDGTYTLQTQAASPFAAVTLLDNSGGTHYAADFDGDGDIDVWAASASTTGEFYINNGNGTFSESDSSTFPAPAAATRVAVGDFDSDGDDDILYQTAGDGSVWQYARSNGDGTMTILSQASSPFAGVTFVNHNGSNSLVGDVDGDGDDDLIITVNGTTGEFYLANGKPPEIASSTPSDNGTGVAVGANITITFDESVTKGSGNIYLYRGDGILIETISVGSAQVTGSGTTWTIDPSVTLAGLTNYYVLFDDGTFVDADGSIFFGVDDPTVLNFTTAAANTAPTFTNLNGDTAAFTEDVSGAVRLDVAGNATVADSDSANFDTGTLTVTITAGGTAAQDVLSVANIGNGAGAIGVSGANISYGGTQIATFTGGTGGTALTITLDPDATPAAVQALVRALQYNNTSNTPSTATRTVTIVLTDGDGGTAATQTTSVTVAASNDAPVAVSGDAVTYTEGGSAVAVSSNLTLTDVDSANMTGATITISDFVAGDVLTFVNQNGISGSYDSGTGVLTLSGSSSVANYQAALRSITYSGAADANVGGTDLTRTVSFVVTDGSNPSSAVTATVTIDNAAGPTPGDDDIDGTNGNDVIGGLAGEDDLDGGDGDDTLDGGDDNDTLTGGAGSDYLKGGAGDDAMTGGTGNDTYVVDSAGDTTDETGGDGVDLVITRVDWTLGADIENLTLGSAGGAIDGTGNDLANVITGNASVNTLTGGLGDDTLSGAGGNDVLNGNEGLDNLDGGNGDDFMDGGADNDILSGAAGNDYLRGGAGADQMTGGAGNDTYAVENAGDVVTEGVNAGIDTVWARISYTLTANVENLNLGAGGGATNGTGNTLDNIINGNYAANTLQGLDGADTLNGNGGNDILEGGVGIDKLYGGAQDDTLYGGDENDTLYGEDHNDTLYGGAGSDKLYGGTGRDHFAFTDEDVGLLLMQHDTILDFDVTQGDRIDLSGIDADSAAGGDQAFTLVTAFSNVAGQAKLFYRTATDQTQILLDVNGDGVADHEIMVNGDLTNMHVVVGGDPATTGGWVL